MGLGALPEKRDAIALGARAESLGVLVGSMLRRSLKLAVQRLGHINRMTEKGALSAGRSLEAIVAEAQTYAQNARATLEGIAGSSEQLGIAEVIASQNEILQSFLVHVGAQAEKQAAVARAALQSSSQIANLGNEISTVAFQARLLSLNASIEAGRMGARGQAFGVIAAEMTKLSQQVESTSKAVNELVSSLSATLPSVSDAAHEMRDASEAFTAEISSSIAQVDQRVRDLGLSVQQTLEAGDGCIVKILSHSGDALSSLQFQDPAAQGLVAIARDFNTASKAVYELVCKGVLAEHPVDMPEAPSSHEGLRRLPNEAIAHVAVVANGPDTAAPGEVLLF